MKRKEKELEKKLRKDLSYYFDVPEGQKAGRDVMSGKRVFPDIICLPLKNVERFKYNFSIEVKVLHEDRKRRELAIGFWQAYEQLHHGIYKDYQLDFALVATEESYSGMTDKELRLYLGGTLRNFSLKNVGWLDMKHGYPVMWMSKTSKHPPHSPLSLWDASSRSPIDEQQLVIREGSGTRKRNGEIDINSIKPIGKIPFDRLPKTNHHYNKQ